MDSILFITNKPFPVGYASTIRFINYSQGLMDAGFRIYVHCINPTENRNNIRNPRARGKHVGIDFKYTCRTTIRSGCRIIRFLAKIQGLVNSLYSIHLLYKTSKIKAIILIGPYGLAKELSYYLISRTKGIRLIQERTEYPFITQKDNLIFKLNLWFYLRISCKLFDGMIVISDVLFDYFKNYLSKRAKIIVVPIVVDPSRFETAEMISDQPEYIAYCGSMQSSKDGIEILIQAFNLISSKYPSLYLKLIGNTDFQGFNELLELVALQGARERVEFTGWVSNEEMAGLLKHAKLLTLARPATTQAEANFPSKIGEYLSTGKPIVTTDVGNIQKYLIHGVNAFLAKQGDVADFAEKMEYVLDHYNEALKVGKAGQELAYSEFNNSYQGRRLAEYISTFLGR